MYGLPGISPLTLKSKHEKIEKKIKKKCAFDYMNFFFNNEIDLFVWVFSVSDNMILLYHVFNSYISFSYVYKTVSLQNRFWSTKKYFNETQLTYIENTNKRFEVKKGIYLYRDGKQYQNISCFNCQLVKNVMLKNLIVVWFIVKFYIFILFHFMHIQDE